MATAPSVSRGRIYFGTGNIMNGIFDRFADLGPGSVLAIGLPD